MPLPGILEGRLSMPVVQAPMFLVSNPKIDAGLDPDNLASKDEIDFGKELQYKEEDRKAWRDIFSAGQGVGSIKDTPATAELCTRLREEYRAAIKETRENTGL